MKIVSAEEAIQEIGSSHRVLVNHCCGQPKALLKEMGRQARRFSKLRVMGGIMLEETPFFDERHAEHFHFYTYHAGFAAREAIRAGRASYVPIRSNAMPAAFAPGGALEADAVLIQVAPPDRWGRYSLGASTAYGLPAAQSAPLVIAQINPRMPRTLGNSFLHEDEIDYAIEVDEELVPYRAANSGETEQRIAERVASLIPNGATVQVGVGGVPEALLGFLTEKKNLRLHSLIVDSALELFESGALVEQEGAHRVGEVMGSRKLFDFVHENPMVHMDHSGVIHSPCELARLESFVCVNSAVEVDLTGQVSAEEVEGRIVAGVGGQMDFAMGGALCPGGISVVALPSRGGRDGKRSRIVAQLSPGSPVSTPRSLVQYVITEHGIANLSGKSLEERRAAMIAIADPEFREDLEKNSRGE